MPRPVRCGLHPLPPPRSRRAPVRADHAIRKISIASRPSDPREAHRETRRWSGSLSLRRCPDSSSAQERQSPTATRTSARWSCAEAGIAGTPLHRHRHRGSLLPRQTPRKKLPPCLQAPIFPARTTTAAPAPPSVGPRSVPRLPPRRRRPPLRPSAALPSSQTERHRWVVGDCRAVWTDRPRSRAGPRTPAPSPKAKSPPRDRVASCRAASPVERSGYRDCKSCWRHRTMIQPGRNRDMYKSRRTETLRDHCRAQRGSTFAVALPASRLRGRRPSSPLRSLVFRHSLRYRAADSSSPGHQAPSARQTQEAVAPPPPRRAIVPFWSTPSS